MKPVNRRYFLKASGAGILPAFIPTALAFAADKTAAAPPSSRPVKLFGDGEMFEPGEYLDELQKANAASPIVRDGYGSGGAVEALEKKFAATTGKEKAIYLPSGTMANQFALAVLSGENTKVFVQDTSHVYRDEADAAQSIFQKRLMPLAKGATYFTAQELQKAMETMPEEEVFKSGIGAVSIENPVRRNDGKTVPIEEIKKIAAFCRTNHIKLHLDGARIYLASAWTGVPVKEYASYFDTVYISLYKYFGAGGGAVLCGDAAVIDKMPHLLKVHGGAMYSNWTNAAMALHRLEGFEARLQQAIKTADEVFAALNAIPGFNIAALPGGTNMYTMQLPPKVDGKKMQATLRTTYNILVPRPDANNRTMISVNETLLYQDAAYLIDAFKKSMLAT